MFFIFTYTLMDLPYVAEVLGAVVSVLIIWVITGILVYAAIQRVITMEFEVEADTMIIVAAIGVVMNIMWVDHTMIRYWKFSVFFYLETTYSTDK